MKVDSYITRIALTFVLFLYSVASNTFLPSVDAVSVVQAREVSPRLATKDTSLALPARSVAQTTPPPNIGKTRPPAASDTFFVADSGGDLDSMILTAVPTALTLRFSINIDRYIASLGNSGRKK